MTRTDTEWSSMDLPVTLATGTPKRRRIVIWRGTNTAVTDTIDVSGTAEPNAADIEGIMWYTANGAAMASGSSLPSWSTNVITLDTTVGAIEMGILVNLT